MDQDKKMIYESISYVCNYKDVFYVNVCKFRNITIDDDTGVNYFIFKT